VEKLGFAWDEVHEIAEELEHIQSEALISKLDDFLGFPTVDPHGDPIPNAKGEMVKEERIVLSEAQLLQTYRFIGVKDSSAGFLQYLDKQKIALGAEIRIVEKEEFDASLLVEHQGKTIALSQKIAENLFVKLG
jgi:DtxR family Mn-dependent transcriptional regulator